MAAPRIETKSSPGIETKPSPDLQLWESARRGRPVELVGLLDIDASLVSKGTKPADNKRNDDQINAMRKAGIKHVVIFSRQQPTIVTEEIPNDASRLGSMLERDYMDKFYAISRPGLINHFQKLKMQVDVVIPTDYASGEIKGYEQRIQPLYPAAFESFAQLEAYNDDLYDKRLVHEMQKKDTVEKLKGFEKYFRSRISQAFDEPERSMILEHFSNPANQKQLHDFLGMNLQQSDFKKVYIPELKLEGPAFDGCRAKFNELMGPFLGEMNLFLSDKSCMAEVFLEAHPTTPFSFIYFDDEADQFSAVQKVITDAKRDDIGLTTVHVDMRKDQAAMYEEKMMTCKKIAENIGQLQAETRELQKVENELKVQEIKLIADIKKLGFEVNLNPGDDKAIQQERERRDEFIRGLAVKDGKKAEEMKGKYKKLTAVRFALSAIDEYRVNPNAEKLQRKLNISVAGIQTMKSTGLLRPFKKAGSSDSAKLIGKGDNIAQRLVTLQAEAKALRAGANPFIKSHASVSPPKAVVAGSGGSTGAIGGQIGGLTPPASTPAAAPAAPPPTAISTSPPTGPKAVVVAPSADTAPTASRPSPGVRKVS